ncbi:DUF4230 domain-containing protein [Streptomyces sp. MNU103]|uniref:DUF4230 domain-containing protein n=1 Tax=Streptomyces sp. MNU103 TaxID=2560024 RepID=UPI003FD4B126
MSRYDAASGNFQVVGPGEGHQVPAGRDPRDPHPVMGAGTVDAYVDLGKLGEDDVQVDGDRTSATLRLPHAALGEPALDPDRSYAVSKQRAGCWTAWATCSRTTRTVSRPCRSSRPGTSARRRRTAS